MLLCTPLVTADAVTSVKVDSRTRSGCYDPRVKYLPLVWAAFRRHTTESLLTFLVITVAFTLFGAMVALKAAYVSWLDTNPLDRLLVTERFYRLGLTIGVRDQIARISGVTGTAVVQGVWGYRQDPSNQVGIYTLDGGTIAALPE